MTYNFILYPKTIDENSYKYKFYDTVEKKIRDCKIYSPFSHYKGNGFKFKRIIGPKKEDTIFVSLFDNYKKIKTAFVHNYTDIWYYTNVFYKDRNNLFIRDNKNNKWFGTSENLFHEATHYATKTKNPFDGSNFWGHFYKIQKKGTGYVMGTLREWQKLVPKGEGHLLTIILHKTTSGIIEVGIMRNIIFFTPPIALRLSYPRTGILKNCKYLRDYKLTEADKKELQAIYPGFCFTYLSMFVRLPLIRSVNVFGAEDIILMEKTEYNKVPLPDFPMMIFFISNNQYSKWFKNTYEVLYKTSVVNIP